MIELKEMCVFPEHAMLIEMENKYGESISVEDIEGSNDVDLSASSTTMFDGIDTMAATDAVGGGTTVGGTAAGGGTAAVKALKQQPKKFKADTDQTNAAFMKAKRDKVVTVFFYALIFQYKHCTSSSHAPSVIPSTLPCPCMPGHPGNARLPRGAKGAYQTDDERDADQAQEHGGRAGARGEVCVLGTEASGKASIGRHRGRVRTHT